MTGTRKRYSADFKAKVALEALKGELALSQLATKHGVHHPEHRAYKCLLRGLTIDRPGQVWCADITYIPMRRGFLYLVAVMDWAKSCPSGSPTAWTPSFASRPWRRTWPVRRRAVLTLRGRPERKAVAEA